MTIEDRLPDLKNAIWKRLGKGRYLRPAGLLEKLGKDLGMHADDVRRAFIRLREEGWLGNISSNGYPLGQVSVVAPRLAAVEPPSLIMWREALQQTAMDDADQTLLESLHTLIDGLPPVSLSRLATGLHGLKHELRQPSSEPHFVLSARFLLGSSKVLGKLPTAPLRQFCPRLFAQPDRIPYVVTAGPKNPQYVILIENPWAFERAIEAGLSKDHALIATFGYGLSRSGEAFGKQLQSLLTGNWSTLIQLRRNPEVGELTTLLAHTRIEFWGDLDLEALRIYRSLLKSIPNLVLSPLYRALEAHLGAGHGHEYHSITGKEGQQPLAAGEFSELPEVRGLAEICSEKGLDQEFLSLSEMADFNRLKRQ